MYIREWITNGRSQAGIVFPILNNLTPTVDSCTSKVLEEVGELFQLIGKHKGASGEEQIMLPRAWTIRMALESIDVAQSAITLAQTLCEDYTLNFDYLMQQHEDKLTERGYLK